MSEEEERIRIEALRAAVRLWAGQGVSSVPVLQAARRFEAYIKGEEEK